jgi:hypothetical protein
MPRLIGDNTERCGGKLKKAKAFLKPNFERGPKLCQVRQVEFWFFGALVSSFSNLTYQFLPNAKCIQLMYLWVHVAMLKTR